jgi:beta-phosphoglucomutase-like phosphatase (HAD superfamily)
MIISTHIVSGGLPNVEATSLLLNMLHHYQLHKRGIVIEDSTAGIKPLKAAGIYCISNSFHSKQQDLSLADKVINHFVELLQYKPKSNFTFKKNI